MNEKNQFFLKEDQLVEYATELKSITWKVSFWRNEENKNFQVTHQIAA